MQTSTVSDRGRTYCRAERHCTGISTRPAYAIAASPANPCIADTSSVPGASYPRAPVIHITPVIHIAPTTHDAPTTHVTSTTPANHAVYVIAAKHPPRQCRTETRKTLCGVDDTADSEASSTTAYIVGVIVYDVFLFRACIYFIYIIKFGISSCCNNNYRNKE